MKSIALTLAVLLSTASARVGLGGCPTFSNVAYDASMNIANPMYFQYIDTLVANGYALGNLLFSSTYATLDCYKLDSGVQEFFASGLTEAAYTDALTYVTSADNPFVAGITHFESSTGTFIGQACVDITTVATFLANLLAANNLSKTVQTLIGVATWILKFAHFQVTVIVSETQTLTDAIKTSWDTTLSTLPGSVPIGYLSQLDVTSATCGW